MTPATPAQTAFEMFGGTHVAIPAQAGFVMFGGTHVATMAFMIAVAVVLSIVLRRARGRPDELRVRRTVCGSLATVMLFSMAAGHVHLVAVGEWTLRESLPLHLCDIAQLLCAATLFGLGRRSAPSLRWQRMYELTYIWGIGGTLQAILTPDIDFTFPSPHYFRYFVNHGGIIVAVLIMTFGLRLRPSRGTFARVWITTLLLSLPVIAINWALGANYMYLMRNPEQPSLLDWVAPWQPTTWWLWLARFASAVALGTVMILFWCAPFRVADWITARRGRPQAGRVGKNN